jgi:hypothetical protein
MKPDVGHIRTFGCVVRVTPPRETLGKLKDRGAMVEHTYEGGYRVWIPRIGVRKSRDVNFFEGSAPVLLDHGSARDPMREDPSCAAAESDNGTDYQPHAYTGRYTRRRQLQQQGV